MSIIRSFVFTYPCPRKLREVIKMSLMEKEMPNTIKTLWTEYHANKTQNVSSVISSSQFSVLNKRLSESPLFLYPVKRETGFFFLISQSQGKSNLFTFLEDYKKAPERAIPYFVATLFDELIISKGIVLARGDIVDHLISKPEANQILRAFLGYYIETGLYEDNVYKFNHQPSKFDYEAHLQSFFSRFG
jgi:ATP synthase mitochondrial F1 complex assembly factor 1